MLRGLRPSPRGYGPTSRRFAKGPKGPGVTGQVGKRPTRGAMRMVEVLGKGKCGIFRAEFLVTHKKSRIVPSLALFPEFAQGLAAVQRDRGGAWVVWYRLRYYGVYCMVRRNTMLHIVRAWPALALAKRYWDHRYTGIFILHMRTATSTQFIVLRRRTIDHHWN